MTSSRFEELERRCAKLKKARNIRFVFVIASLFLVAFGAYYYWLKDSENEVILVSPSFGDTNISVPTLYDQNESTISISKVLVVPEPEIKEEALFLAPHIYKDVVKLPSVEIQEAKKSLSEEEHLLNAFQTEQNFLNAYTIAVFYFERKSYSEVVQWAKEASRLDSGSDLPWILYAKAKFYLGDRAEAIRSLELFLSYINSKEAQELLNFYKGQE